ncbi:carboxypeptidase-like regulatory domain-containing protein [Lacihabitans sp. LS3-19]|uniref:carboxypeptidase-like regulatory domain-containing protein n=1 Tax=Lacihabitans sp. LS3-19 TaxID=2487335 RepID=UPI0020CF72A2|nr:carboxypeptidase-like regulatory domain-containing protein [Lacihabitans sp. LS3-19]
MYTISGKVEDAKTGEGLPFVNVYFQGSTIGTQTDDQGKFIIRKIKGGKYRLVASMVSFKPDVQVLTVDKNIEEISIKLEEDIKALKELKIVAKRDKEWEANFKEFSREFLGNNFKKKDVKIANKEVVNFERKNEILSASSFEPIIIENKKMGYKVFFILDYFQKDQRKIGINGIPRFEVMTPKDKVEEELWEKNRKAAYLGSIKHFFKSVLYRQIKEQGFSSEYLETDPEYKVFNEEEAYGKHPSLKFNDSTLVYKTNVENMYLVNFAHRVFVRYWNRNRWVERSILKQEVPIEVDELGNLFDPMSVEISGGMADRRMANLLPFDYEIGDLLDFDFEELTLLLPKEVDEKFRNPREEIEIENLQPYYLAGENLNVDLNIKDIQSGFSATFSKILYADFIDLGKGEIINNFKLKVNNAQAKLGFELPKNLTTGNYQLRMYTNWMRNFSEAGFLKVDFTVFGKNFMEEMPDNINIGLEDIKVHVEANTALVNGLKSRILIESLDNFGRNMPTSFKIVSPKNNEVVVSATDSLGMCLVEFIPTEDGEYKILGGNKSFKMPAVEKKGMVLAADYISSTEKLRMQIQNKGLTIDSVNIAIVKSGQIVYYNKIINNLNSYVLNLDIPFQSSNLSIFLLDEDFEVIAEKTQLVDSMSKDYFIKSNLTFKEPISYMFDYDRKYEYEKGLKVSGTVLKSNGTVFIKPVDIKFMVSDDVSDTTNVKPQIFDINTLDKFEIEGLDFFGKKQLTYICNKCEVNLDTIPSLPPVFAEQRPINWTLLMNKGEWESLQKRKEMVEDLFKNENLSEAEIIHEKPKKENKNDKKVFIIEGFYKP